MLRFGNHISVTIDYRHSTEYFDHLSGCRRNRRSKSATEEIVEFANSVDSDEVAHNESPQLDLHCLPSSL